MNEIRNSIAEATCEAKDAHEALLLMLRELDERVDKDEIMIGMSKLVFKRVEAVLHYCLEAEVLIDRERNMPCQS